jgi:hypothetical protein
MGPLADVLDAEDPDAPGAAPASRSGWVVGLLALLLVVVGAVWLVPRGEQDRSAELRLLGHTGHALEGQSFLRLYFLVGAGDTDVVVEDVEVVLGGTRSAGTPTPVDTRGRQGLLVDLVPDCRTAVRDLPLGTLEVDYRAGGSPATAEIALPVEGSLPRLLARRCS